MKKQPTMTVSANDNDTKAQSNVRRLLQETAPPGAAVLTGDAARRKVKDLLSQSRERLSGQGDSDG